MHSIPSAILLAVFLVFVGVPLIIVGSVLLFLSISDSSRKVPPHTLRRIH
jgi:hypothetical protein